MQKKTTSISYPEPDHSTLNSHSIQLYVILCNNIYLY